MRTDRSSLQSPLNPFRAHHNCKKFSFWTMEFGHGPPILETFLLNPQIESPLSIIVQTGSPSDVTAAGECYVTLLIQTRKTASLYVLCAI